MKKALKVGGIAILLAAAAAYAADGVVLKYVYKKDAVSKVRIKGTLEMQGTQVTVELVNQTKVKEVGDDGTATLEDGLLEGKATFNGQDIDIPSQPANIIVMKANGEVKEIRGESMTDDTYRLQNLMGFVTPTDAVQVGSKWNRDVPADKEKKTPAYKAEYTITGEETVQDTPTFKVEYKVYETEGTDPAKVEGTVWVAKDDCSVVKGSAKWENVPQPGAPVPISGNFTMERIK
ncbi:MAG: hypothetical protein JST12_03970 [Armatimonadetes bacterium]|nr:hypothetical protein [Armatimonadota bacterium]MBS1700794.1 hypothetical protein [Armatimonadota bacterium]MBS1728716.1 hypothetical protein [Armatimonadota bacterium]